MSRWGTLCHRRRARRAADRGDRRRHAGRLPAAAHRRGTRIRNSSISAAGICARDAGYAWGLTDGAQAAPGYPSPTESSLGNGLHRRHRRRHQDALAAHRRHRRLHLAAEIHRHRGHRRRRHRQDLGAGARCSTAMSISAPGIGMTPYVGAGVGVGYMHVSDYASTVAPPFSGRRPQPMEFQLGGHGGPRLRHHAQSHARRRLPLHEFRRRADRQRRLRPDVVQESRRARGAGRRALEFR